jgi:hypothetical protein
MTASTSPAAPRCWQELAAEQDGVVGRRQAMLAGLSEDQWQWRLDSGRWQSVLPGVAVVHSGPVTERQRAFAAVVYAGEGARLSADAALVVHGMRHLPVTVVHVAVPAGRVVRPQAYAAPGDTGGANSERDRARDRSGSTGWRVGDGSSDEQHRLEPHQVSHLALLAHPVRRPATVRPAPAVLHAAAWAPSDRAAEWRIAAAVQQRLVAPQQLRTALADMSRLHRRPLVRAVLDDVEQGAHAAGELDFLRFLRVHALPPPDRLQRPVRSGTLRYLDAWWERQRVNVELDGAHHRRVGAWEDDALRANDVVVAERHDRIVLLRFTRGNLRHDGPRVASQLRAVLL